MPLVAHLCPFRRVKYKTVLSSTPSPLCHFPVPLLRVCFALISSVLQQMVLLAAFVYIS